LVVCGIIKQWNQLLTEAAYNMRRLPMVITKESKVNMNPLDFVKALDHVDALKILVKLCKEEPLRARIVKMAKASLSKVDANEVADDVFSSLNSILVEDLWDNSGKTRWGYHEPTEVAFEMMESEIEGFIQQMVEYRTLGMKKEEKIYCQGILEGLLEYGNEGTNEFHDYVPDDPYTIADNVFEDWKEHNSDKDIKEIKSVYDSYFFQEEGSGDE
jgi:hypothetical protein